MRLSYDAPVSRSALGPAERSAIDRAEAEALSRLPHVEAHCEAIERICGVRPTVRLTWSIDGDWYAVWALQMPAGFERYNVNAMDLFRAARAIDPAAPMVAYHIGTDEPGA